MVEKFQLLQTAHEVLSDPAKRATYDRTRGATGRATAAHTRSTTSTTAPHTPKNRYTRQSTGANGFSKTTPKPAFGHFTTREPPSSAGRTSTKPHPATRPATRKSPEKDRAEAYFGRFREKTTTPSWQHFSSTTASPNKTPHAKAQQRKEEAQKAAGVKTPDRRKPTQTRFGTTFEKETSEEEEGEEDTFFSFSSNGGSFNGTEKKDNSHNLWSDRRSAYSHIFSGVKEDVRSPLKSQSTGFPSDGFGAKKNGPTNDGTKTKPNGTTTNGFGGFTKETEKKLDIPPVFSFNGPARRKSSQQQPSTSETTTASPPTDPNEIPKTPPPVDERRFASAFSRLNVNHTSPAKPVPLKQKEQINLEDWTKKFEGMNPFMTPETKKLSEDKNFWSSVPLKSTPIPATKGRPIRAARSVKNGGLDDMGDLKKELPKMGGMGTFDGPGVAPVFASFNMQVPKPSDPIFPTSPIKPTPPDSQTPNHQQPTPATTPAFHFLSPPPTTFPVSEIPVLNAPIPPKRLIPRPSSPKEFSFSVPSKPEMQLLAAEVQAYHAAYVAERSRFEEAWNKYEAEIQFQFTNEAKVRTYLDVKDKLIKQRAEMETLHSLCLERWGSVAKFSGFTG